MRVQFNEVGHLATEDDPQFNAVVDMDAVPRVGDIVNTGTNREVTVRTVVWFPVGENGSGRPGAYIVVGPPRS
jgi:hypothetical protein